MVWSQAVGEDTHVFALQWPTRYTVYFFLLILWFPTNIEFILLLFHLRARGTYQWT